MSARRSISRRQFVQSVAAGAAAAGLVAAARPLDALSDSPLEPTPPAKAMPTRPFGRTGHDVRLFSLGGQATLEQEGTTEESLAIIHRAIDLGVNYLDTARRYGNGISEGYYGQVLKARRREVFLATKTRERTYDGAMRDLETSLKTLQTDHLDLWQCHNVMYDRELDQMFAKDGVTKAMEKARDQKLVRFVGITGHYDPLVLKRGIEHYQFDTILMALNAADRHRSSFIDQLLPVAAEKKMGIIGMKIPARGRLLRDDGVRSMQDAMRYVLSLPVSTVIVGISKIEELEENVRIAREFAPMAAKEMQALEALAKPYAEDAMFFKAKA